jgi:hypothetical protein
MIQEQTNRGTSVPWAFYVQVTRFLVQVLMYLCLVDILCNK